MKNAPLIESLGIRLRGVTPLERLAGQIVVGLELSHLKKTLGYAGVGEWNAYRGEIRPTWDELCMAQAGFSPDTARLLDICAEAVKVRLAADSLRNGAADDTWCLMETPPSELTATERQELVNGILKHALRKGDTRLSLIHESTAPYKKTPKPEKLDPAAVARGENPPTPGDQPANRFRDMVAFTMASGVGFKRACEVMMIMMPDDMLSLHELAWKRLHKQLAANFFETVSQESPEE
jgi:hypothetical protein